MSGAAGGERSSAPSQRPPSIERNGQEGVWQMPKTTGATHRGRFPSSRILRRPGQVVSAKALPPQSGYAQSIQTRGPHEVERIPQAITRQRRGDPQSKPGWRAGTAPEARAGDKTGLPAPLCEHGDVGPRPTSAFSAVGARAQTRTCRAMRTGTGLDLHRTVPSFGPSVRKYFSTLGRHHDPSC